MKKKYVENIPFEYKKYAKRKAIELPDNIIQEFNMFYDDIQQDKYEVSSKDTSKLSDMPIKKHFDKIKDLVAEAVRESGNKKSIYVDEYVELIFGVCFFLIKKYGVSQAYLSKLVGLNANKFSKLDIYPKRSHSAYSKICNKTLQPFETSTLGTKIAECINKTVQTEHCCYAFVGVTNDLDLFANISCTDDKAFVLTMPYDFGNIDSIRCANKTYAEYLFALSNLMIDDHGKYLPAGIVIKEILELLQMHDNLSLSIQEQNVLVRSILLGDTQLEQYIIGDFNTFESKRSEYREMYSMLKILEYNMDDYDYAFMAEPDEKNKYVEYFNDGDSVTNKYKELSKSLSGREQELIAMLRVTKLLRSEDVQFVDYLGMIHEYLMSKTFVDIQEYLSTGGGGNKTINIDDRCRFAACYWVDRVFRGREKDEQFKEDVMNYLTKKCPLYDYFDALNAPPAVKKQGQSPQANAHVYVIDERGDLFGELKKVGKTYSEESIRPLMVYVDTADLAVDAETIAKWCSEHKCIVIIHDTKGVCKKWGMLSLDEGLDLYIKYDEVSAHGA